jgi:DNA polymerase I-like protein with 3'-5' exonuclease and polymerase domains
MINAHAAGAQLILTVHDQLVALAPEADAARDMALLREAMESVGFDLSMPTDGKIGRRLGELRADAAPDEK